MISALAIFVLSCLLVISVHQRLVELRRAQELYIELWRLKNSNQITAIRECRECGYFFSGASCSHREPVCQTCWDRQFKYN